MRAVAVAAALTSTSLRERWREPGDEAAAGVLEWAALAGGGQTEDQWLRYELLNTSHLTANLTKDTFYHLVGSHF